MKSTFSPCLTDDELHQLVDGQNSPEHLARLQAKLASDPDGQARLLQWQAQRANLRSLHEAVLEEAVPPALAQTARQVSAPRDEGRPWWRYGGMAAGLVMAFGAGWVGHAVWPQAGLNSALWSNMARTDIERSFVRQASVAHSVYTPEIKHPVEVTAQEQAHLVQWLSKRLGRPLKVPSLTAQGFELVGGRLLPSDSGARAQFMFQNASGSRITLYLGAVDVMPGQTASKETSFRYELQSGVPSFYWVDQGFGYALSGQVPRDVLMTLAEAVYGQL